MISVFTSPIRQLSVSRASSGADLLGHPLNRLDKIIDVQISTPIISAALQAIFNLLLKVQIFEQNGPFHSTNSLELSRVFSLWGTAFKCLMTFRPKRVSAPLCVLSASRLEERKYDINEAIRWFFLWAVVGILSHRALAIWEESAHRMCRSLQNWSYW